METRTQSQSALDAILRIAADYFKMPIKLDALSDDASYNAFEFAEALYWHCRHNYNGMSSLEYWITCNLEYKLGMNHGCDGVEPDNLFITLFGDDVMSDFLECRHNEILELV